MIKVHITNNDGFHSSSKWEDDNYTPLANETLIKPPTNIFKHKLEGGVWVEGMSEEEKDTIAIPLLLKRQEYEIPNLRLGAKRIASGFTGTETQIDNQISFAKDKYLWAKGELKVSESANAAYLAELQVINIKRAAEELPLMSEDDFKQKVIVPEFEIRNNLLITFNAFIKAADDKLTMLIEQKDTSKALQVIELMEDVEEDTTEAEAELILYQILSI